MQKIDEQILKVKQQLLALENFHPGSLSRQYQVCGKAGCKCGDSQNPRPHGPYTKLTYVYGGKFKCRFVRAESVQEVAWLVSNYKKFRHLMDKWIALAIKRALLGPFLPTTRKRNQSPHPLQLPKTSRRKKK